MIVVNAAYCLILVSFGTFLISTFTDLQCFSFSTEKPTLLKQVNAHDMQNQSQGGLMEGDENVRPILFSHFLVYYPRYEICPFL